MPNYPQQLLILMGCMLVSVILGELHVLFSNLLLPLVECVCPFPHDLHDQELRNPISDSGAFCIILGDTMPSVLNSLLPSSISSTGFFKLMLSRDFLICLFTLSISYPLSLYRDIEKLSRASALALIRFVGIILCDVKGANVFEISMCIILLVVAVHGPTLDSTYKGPSQDKFTVVQSGIPSAIGVISFAYVCHHNTCAYIIKYQPFHAN